MLFAQMMKNRQKEFYVLRTIYGMHHLREVLQQRDQIKHERELEFEQKLQPIVRTFQLHMLKKKIVKYQNRYPIAEYPDE